MRIIDQIKWRFRGKPMYKIEEWNCGCCGKYYDEPFLVPLYEQYDYEPYENSRVWSLCPKGEGCRIYEKELIDNGSKI